MKFDSLGLFETASVSASLMALSAIQKENLVVRVANVQLKSTDIDDQIVIGQGFLNGSLYYQSESLSKVNRMVLRRLGMLDRVLNF